MNYSLQFTREAIFKAAKINTVGNVLVLAGLWAITPDNDTYFNTIFLVSICITVFAICLIYLGITFRINFSEKKQQQYMNTFYIVTTLKSITFGVFLALQAKQFGFLSTPHLGAWVFFVAMTEAMVSYLYHYPKFFLLNFACLYIPSLILMVSIGTMEALTISLIVIVYAPIIFVRMKELKQLKEQMISLLVKSHEKQNQLKTFIDLIPAKITWLDSNLKYIGVNKEFLDSTMAEGSESLIGKTFGQKSPNALITKEINNFLNSNERNKNFEIEIDVNAEARWHLCQFSKQAFSHGDEIFLITIDIHEQKLIKSELDDQRAISDQASKFASLGEMAAGIAHEINNPLTIIQGSSQLLKTLTKKNKLSPELLEKHLNKITDTNDRIVNIVTGMKAFSRSSENVEIEIEKIKHIIETTLLFCKEKFKIYNVELVVASIDQNITCECRPQQLNQILLNFLNNAFDAISDLKGKKIVNVYLEQFESYNVLCVSDNGSGIENMEKIFTPYFTTKGAGKGTGIGLSISQKIAAAHKGYIKAFREDEKTVFKLFLPKNSSESK